LPGLQIAVGEEADGQGGEKDQALIEEGVAVDSEEGGDGVGELAGRRDDCGAGQDEAQEGYGGTEGVAAADGDGEEQQNGRRSQDQQGEDGEQARECAKRGDR
jgi:hypothetical protein